MFILQQCNKCNTLKKTPSSGKSLITTYSMFFLGGMDQKGGGVGVGAYLSLSLSGREAGWGWALIRINALFIFK